ncbi:hypothetical protein FGG08_003280 [Glutinoglossum americanum]|uniref:C3H1-type domain-containing protein n=1 Tax=Glutinoglossum americanum TaxID=1670608 RepID=A0A9P8L3T9_9PEZI|nr:hypothetical protein FGG08_003280 [Glutinoglossum americanum]
MSLQVSKPNKPISANFECRRSELRPTFFMSRGGGVFTPLIPADELPADIVIVGVPRVMSFGDTAGMTSVGEIMASGLYYETKASTDVNQRHEPGLPLETQSYRASDTMSVKSPLAHSAGGPAAPPPVTFGGISARLATGIFTPTIGNTSLANPGNQHSDEPDRRGRMDKANGSSPNGVGLVRGSCEIDSVHTGSGVASMSSLGPQAVINAITSTTPAPGRAFPCSRPVQRQRGQGPTRCPVKDYKKYCSYWVRHGECDYTQQGCKFLHEMPQDRETLVKIGLRDFPRWWKEPNALTTWRHRSSDSNAVMPPAGLVQPYDNGASPNGNIAFPSNSAMVVARPSQFDEGMIAGPAPSTPEQMRGPSVITPRLSTAHQRQSRTQNSSGSSLTTQSSSPASSPESPYACRFVPGLLHPQTRALRIQKLMSPESFPEGGFWIEKNAKGEQKEAGDPSKEDPPKPGGCDLIELQGLNVP